MKIEIKDLIQDGPKYVLPNISVDSVIFGYHEKELKVLLQRPQGISKWMLPGGYVHRDETIKQAAERVVKNRTGLDRLFLNQFQSFGTPTRTKDSELTPALFAEINQMELDENHWMFDYFVSIGFYSLTEFSKVVPSGEFYLEECTWWNIGDLPSLLYDHQEIIEAALKALRLHIYHYPIGYELLPEKFTLPEIHSLYETILDKTFDSRNFGKKLIATGIIKKLDERRNIGAHRAPFLYVFDMENYNQALENGYALFV
ncbi:NrtR DNA-binding winged helix domain-containing protein [Mangrovibacterium marinum]|uniref:ADP-ribose pyrophosphatase YjhB (NUDIX family) n=1 Tax=Mangrovibacterium marinum TaxID=1639118 RepID=A0A2T5BYZ4_9BACT|nr:NUDIX domain-containing protein [Mangrovibacterium marinum]PTN07464.1 ADP-ribose pyrophosphatase YjhB (NUDIX family) [Mangrovibacterium marinum]